MSAWGNTDNHNQKPKSPQVRENRDVLQLTVASGNTAGNTVITVTAYDGGPSTLANVGVASGQYVYFWSQGFNASNGGLAGNGTPGMFLSNTTVSSVSGNTVTLANPLYNTVSAGFGVEFDKAIVYQANKQLSTYNKDTILVTPSRTANSTMGAANTGNFNTGWVHIQKKTNNDGTVRYLRETLVALANPVASNTSSANTSFGQPFTGV